MTTTTAPQTLDDVRRQLREASHERDRTVRELASRQQAEIAAARTQSARDRLSRLHGWQARELLSRWRRTIHALMDEQERLDPPTVGRIPPHDYAPGERQRLLRIQRDD
jgi:hypothetical protein